MAGGDMGEGNNETYFSTAGNMGADRYGAGNSMFGSAYNGGNNYGVSGFNGTNQNYFDLDTGMGSTEMGSFGPPGTKGNPSGGWCEGQ